MSNEAPTDTKVGQRNTYVQLGLVFAIGALVWSVARYTSDNDARITQQEERADKMEQLITKQTAILEGLSQRLGDIESQGGPNWTLQLEVMSHEFATQGNPKKPLEVYRMLNQQ